MNSRRLPSGSREYTLVASTRRAPSPRAPDLRSTVGAGVVEHRRQRLRRTAPHEAEIAARRPAAGARQGEVVALPHLGAMEVDHLVTDMDRHEVRVSSTSQPSAR